MTKNDKNKPHEKPGGRVLMTPGVLAMAEYCRADSLLQMIVNSQSHEEVFREEFQVWKYMPDKNGVFSKLVCEDGNDNLVFSTDCTIVDFPALDGIILFFANNTLLLPGEQ